jgi:hypothetical protein
MIEHIGVYCDAHKSPRKTWLANFERRGPGEEILKPGFLQSFYDDAGTDDPIRPHLAAILPRPYPFATRAPRWVSKLHQHARKYGTGKDDKWWIDSASLGYKDERGSAASPSMRAADTNVIAGTREGQDAQRRWGARTTITWDGEEVPSDVVPTAFDLWWHGWDDDPRLMHVPAGSISPNNPRPTPTTPRPTVGARLSVAFLFPRCHTCKANGGRIDADSLMEALEQWNCGGSPEIGLGTLRRAARTARHANIAMYPSATYRTL